MFNSFIFHRFLALLGTRCNLNTKNIGIQTIFGCESCCRRKGPLALMPRVPPCLQEYPDLASSWRTSLIWPVTISIVDGSPADPREMLSSPLVGQATWGLILCPQGSSPSSAFLPSHVFQSSANWVCGSQQYKVQENKKAGARYHHSLSQGPSEL